MNKVKKSFIFYIIDGKEITLASNVFKFCIKKGKLLFEYYPTC